ncbi:hypothetical protein [uncultured Psychrosphaera sp.]|uniref:hypothetical protein n=1 Tax=uncultured Psychrosphaera sp. TaxID=1403522 RepID=UPI0026221537|nr:hypothetical protein [uncultured Psychrosphaera sp.]
MNKRKVFGVLALIFLAIGPLAYFIGRTSKDWGWKFIFFEEALPYTSTLSSIFILFTFSFSCAFLIYHYRNEIDKVSNLEKVGLLGAFMAGGAMVIAPFYPSITWLLFPSVGLCFYSYSKGAFDSIYNNIFGTSWTNIIFSTFIISILLYIANVLINGKINQVFIGVNPNLLPMTRWLVLITLISGVIFFLSTILIIISLKKLMADNAKINDFNIFMIAIVLFIGSSVLSASDSFLIRKLSYYVDFNSVSICKKIPSDYSVINIGPNNIIINKGPNHKFELQIAKCTLNSTPL